MDKKSNVELLMLVDDSKIDTYVHEKVLMMASFAETLLIKGSASDALNYLQHHHGDIDSVPGLLFLDINMPVMDGFGFLEAFSSLSDMVKEKCKIVMLSSSDLKEDRERALAYNSVIGFLSKPLTLEKLTLVEKLIAEIR